MRTLQSVIVILSEKWKAEEKAFAEALEAEGIRCERYDRKSDVCGNAICGEVICEEVICGEDKREIQTMYKLQNPAEARLHTVIVIDNRALCAQFSALGFVCVGLEGAEYTAAENEKFYGVSDAEPAVDSGCFEGTDLTTDSGFFEGAELVTDALESLDADTLEECLLHATGRPVTVAGTEALVLREMTEHDVDRLYEISVQSGAEYALAGGFEENFFRRETLLAYIRHAYRFFGYGIWSVLKKDGALIGCCGFAERDGRIELQYMLDEAYRRRGYGTQMCEAALRYAASRMDWERVYVRIASENEPSLRFAKRLGFREEEGSKSSYRGENSGVQENDCRAGMKKCKENVDSGAHGNSLQPDYIMLEYRLV